MLGRIHLGAPVPGNCCSPPQSWDLARPQGCVLFHSLPSQTAVKDEFLLLLRVGECYTRMYIRVYIRTHRWSLSSSQTTRAAVKRWYSGRGRKEEREIIMNGMNGGNCKPFAGRKGMIAAGRGGEQGMWAPAEIWGKQHPRPWGRVKTMGHVEGTVSGCAFLWQNSKVSSEPFNLSSSCMCSYISPSFLQAS